MPDSVPLLSNYFFQLRQGVQKYDAMVESLRINFQPILVTSVTTALGFLSMNFSEVPPLQHLGNVVAVGVMVAFALSVTFLPALVYCLPIRVKVVEAKEGSFVRWLRALSEFVIRRRRSLMWSMIAISLAFMIFLPKNQINDEFVKYFDESIDFRADTDYASEHLLGPYTFEYNLQTDEANGISEPEFLKTLQQFVEYLEGFEEVSHVNSITDIMKRLNKNLHGDDPEWYRLPESRELAAQYLLLYEMSLPYGLDLNNQIDIDKSSTRVTVTVKNLSSKQVLALEEQWAAWLNDNAGAYKFSAASPNLMFAHIGQRNAKSMVGGLLLALFGISLILIFALRSVKLGLLSLIPNLVPIGIGFGFWGMVDGTIGMALSIVSGMTLGIVVDDTVHFLSKYLRAHREKGLSAADAIRYAFTQVGPALVTTTIVLIAGFLVLSVSTFRMNADMGVLTAFTIGVALVVDFLLLPPLLMKVDSKSA
ncbi:MMPL family transporter [bacterium]|nr:MMPL family transporter [bacterium]